VVSVTSIYVYKEKEEEEICRPICVEHHCRRFDPGGVPGPTSKLSLRVPAQMGRRETEHKGEQKRGTTARVVLRLGRMLLQ
jgi:hypothetical protein